MRKPAPVLILTTLIAFASGSALALGDRAKEKKSTTDTHSMTQPAATSNAATPGSSPAPSAPTKATTDGSAASATATPPAPSASVSSSSSAPVAANTYGSTTDKADMSKKKKDGKCDEAKYQGKSAIPPECAEKVSPGSSASSSK